MKKRAAFYIALVLGMVIGSCLALGSWAIRPKDAQAQCVRLGLASCLAPGPCSCPSGTRISETLSDPAGAGYRIALCMNP